VLFLPTPFKIISAPSLSPPSTTTKSEILKPGALYANCAVVKLAVPTPSMPKSSDKKGKQKEDGMEGNGKQEKIEDDGELGGELAGRLVWEEFEVTLKTWEKAVPESQPERKVEGEATLAQ
jgi:hypothetical protein